MARIEFKRGDGATHYFKMPSDSWSAGGMLRFAAKPIPDDDSTDAAALINVTFDDTVVTDDGDYKKYTLDFVASDTDSILTSNAKYIKLLGEFQWTPASGDPTTYPGNDKYIETIVYADIARETP